MRYLFALLFLASCSGIGNNLPPTMTPSDSVGGGLPAKPAIFQGVDPNDTPGGPILKSNGIGSQLGAVNIDDQWKTNQFFVSSPLGCTKPDGGILNASSVTETSVASEPCSFVAGDAVDPRWQCLFSTEPLALVKEGEFAVCSVVGSLALWNLKDGAPMEPDDTPGGPIL
jgi:hypothetical protein